jgi:histidinol-phosphatase (PHP family)
MLIQKFKNYKKVWIDRRYQMRYIDYHLHTNFSIDSSATIDAIVRKSKEMGHREICFTQHFDVKKTMLSGVKLYESQIPSYIKQVEAARKKYGVPVKVGLEMDYHEELEDEIRRVINSYDLDFTLGSVHYLDDQIVEWIRSKVNLPFFETNRDRIIKTYFERLNKLVKSRLFDAAAHIDVFRRFLKKEERNIPFELYKKEVMEVIRLIKKYDVGFEVNSSGIQKIGEQYPKREIIEMAYKAGIRKVVIGSDTHHTEQLSKDLDKVITLLKEIGYRKVAVFDKHKVSYIPIAELEK